MSDVRLLQSIYRQSQPLEPFKVADDVLRQWVQGISDLSTVNGLTHLYFADVKAVMSNAGSALMGIGRAAGEDRALHAAQQAIDSPLLEVSIDGARGILFNVIGGSDMSMHEINQAAEQITAAADPEANIIFGATINPDLQGEMIITVVATGFDDVYYANRTEKERAEDRANNIVRSPKPADMKSLDMDLPEESATKSLDDDTPMPNIWSMHEDDDEPTAHEKTETETAKETSLPEETSEEELEKPSFLRRLTRRRSESKTDTTDTTPDTPKKSK